MRLESRGKKASSQSTGNRSDEVRQRRSSRSQQRVSTASQRAMNPVRVRPVVVRGNTYGTPIHRKTSQRASRRTFYLTVDQAIGTEVRLPSLPMLRPGWRLLSGLISIVTLVGIFSLWNSPFFRVADVEVTGLERISPEELSGVLHLDNLSIVEIDTSDATSTLVKRFPELIGVGVHVSLPNIVAVTASERQPIIVWQKGDALNWLDADGVIFPARGEAGPLIKLQSEDDLPLEVVIDTSASTGAISEDNTSTSTPAGAKTGENIPVTGPRKVDPSLVTAVVGLSQKLSPETQLIYSKKDGLGWVDAQGCHVFIGRNLDDFEAKYNMYEQMTSFLGGQGISPALISVAQIDAPFYRLEP